MQPSTPDLPLPLEELTRRATARALREGALAPVASESTILAEGGIWFQIRRLGQRPHRPVPPGGTSPFAPFDPALHVADLGPEHVCLLNKYPVLEGHLLVVTRAFAPQETLLTRGDLRALALALAGLDGLGFYNGGAAAGASQRHKHLQLVPALAPPARCPVEPAVRAALGMRPVAVLPEFRFAHAAVPLGLEQRPDRDAEQLEDAYRALLQVLGAADPHPYNLLVTRSWMLVVLRSTEAWQGISVNALGFAGALLVPDASARASLEAAGPLQALAAVSRPPGAMRRSASPATAPGTGE
jgi:ATP adenylyltransferase